MCNLFLCIGAILENYGVRLGGREQTKAPNKYVHELSIKLLKKNKRRDILKPKY